MPDPKKTTKKKTVRKPATRKKPTRKKAAKKAAKKTTKKAASKLPAGKSRATAKKTEGNPYASKGAADVDRVLAMSISSLHPLYVTKVERKGRTEKEVDQIIRWLTGYTAAGMKKQMRAKASLKTFVDEAPKIHPNMALVTGAVCGYRVEEITDRRMRVLRCLDRLIDELAKGRPMEKILRK